MEIKDVMFGKTERKSYAKYQELMPMPNLLKIQRDSYNWFLNEGLREVFRDIAKITDYSDKWELSFLDYTIDEKPKYTVEQCKERDATYARAIKVVAKLLNKETGHFTTDPIFLGEFPMMTNSGTFVINGAERVVVSQIVRSPGMYYGDTVDKANQHTYTATVIPYRGAWLEYETDLQNVFSVRIDKNRKLPITHLIRALGVETDEQIYEMFGNDERIKATIDKDDEKDAKEARDKKDRISVKTSRGSMIEIYRRLRPGEPATEESARAHIDALFFDARRYDVSRVGRYKFNKKMDIWSRIEGQEIAQPVVDPRTGEILAMPGDVLNREQAKALSARGVCEAFINVNGVERKVFSNYVVDMKNFVDFDPAQYGIQERVSRGPLFELLDKNLAPEEWEAEIAKNMDRLQPKHITREDIFASINYLNCVAYGVGSTDDIDHLGNRRLRCVGELLQNQFRVGFTRLERVIRERMTVQENMTPQNLINIRPVTAVIKEFFGSSPLSQFMDQNNPLAELTHKRRLSALGPGGLSRERASFDVRDVHYSHYGRMCPIETPEGPNIGLINYLSSFARINEYGFIEAPYRKIEKIYDENGKYVNSRPTEEFEYMSADVEDDYYIAQAKEPLDEDGCLSSKRITCRHRDEIIAVDKERIDYLDVSPRMMTSIATAFIPFLQNDDANRALMGANMQRQAVPLMVTEAPIVATGIERKCAVDSEVCLKAEGEGTITRVSANHISIRYDNGEVKEYPLTKFARSNQGTCVNQRPIVDVGERVVEDQIIADGPACSQGEISLGKNVLIGFVTWEGYNYEDAILLNERLVREDVFTSIHIEEYETEARDTKLGPEEITRDIPNAGEDALKDLDEDGVIRIGAEVKSGDYLVGKVTPKGETELTAEERLLRAIFGEKAREVRDTSLKVPHGEAGIIVDVKVFTRQNGDDLAPGVNKVVRVYIAQKRKISVGDKMAGRHGNKGVVSRVLPEEDMPFLPDGTPLDIVLNPLGVPSRMNIGQVLEVHLGYAAHALGWKVATPIFDGANEKDIRETLKLAGLREDGKTLLYDGRTGEPFDNLVTVGYPYFLKLHHLVDDKIHARSTGPYSLVTQQPLGGKAQFGGQRFGEMEVWALEAYGAAYTLQEILTVKSDDVTGRVKSYEAIVKGYNIPKAGVPESFRVLVKELQSLCLDIRVLDEQGEEVTLRDSSEDDDYPVEHKETVVTDEREVRESGFDLDTEAPGGTAFFENGDDFHDEENDSYDDDSFDEE